MITFITEYEGCNHYEDFTGKGFYRIRITTASGKYLYVQMNPEQSSFPPWLKNHGLTMED